LRDVDLEMLDRQRAELDPDVYRRCRHVVEENKRLLAGCDELRRGDLAGFGQRMYDSHRGLRDDYSVSCSELDILVEIAAGIEGVYGARMMGGGFGGCTINLVQADAVVEFSTAVTARYGQRTGWSPRVFVTQIAGGTAVEA
jgi:galactokinase